MLWGKKKQKSTDFQDNYACFCFHPLSHPANHFSGNVYHYGLHNLRFVFPFSFYFCLNLVGDKLDVKSARFQLSAE